MNCKNCNGLLPDGASFCPSCGSPVTKPQEETNDVPKYCIKCGTAIPAGTTECPNCQKEIEQTQEQEQKSVHDTAAVVVQKPEEPESPKKTRPRNKIILVVGAVVLAVLLFCSETMRMLGFLAGLILFPVSLVMFIVCLVRKEDKRRWIILIATAFILMLVYLVMPTPCTEHTWEEATCTEPAECSTCGEKEAGSELGHDWMEADCTSPKACSRCDLTEGEPLEHTPGEWEVVTEATTYSAGERAILCTVCGETLDSEEIEQLPELTPDEYKAQCQSYSYDTIARNPGQYDGEYAKISGYVLQVQQDELYGLLLYTLRVATVGKYDGVVYVSYTCSADDARILEDDYVTMWGQLTGEKTYTTVMGNSITIPSFTAEYVQ
ncbi:MAG: zinc ribbon domain-containing protein [Ruminiclostridium sp.]|nr:zinc ribbon domain-containing protein [Ruminiclostridium sp.]